MPMPAAMRAKMQAYTAQLQRQVQDILKDPTLTPKKQAENIKNIKGAEKEDMYKFLNDNFRVGPDLADSIKEIISKNRPVGGPSKSTISTISTNVK